MNTAAKLSAYGAALALIISGAWATGSAVGPLTAVSGGHRAARSGARVAGHGDAHSGTVAQAATDQPGGLAFQDVHPERTIDGTWSVPLTKLADGSYWAFADVTPAAGVGATLGADLAAPGSFEPSATPRPRIEFVAEISSDGDSRLFVDFRHDGCGPNRRLHGTYRPCPLAPASGDERSQGSDAEEAGA